MKSQTVHIEKIVNGGYGLARIHDGKVLFLRGALPDEEVTYTITTSTRSSIFGEVTSVVTPNPQRISPPCPFYKDCGGCNMQHCTYPMQLQIKYEIMQELFRKLNIEPLAPQASADPFAYRQRIRLQVHQGKIGFARFKSNDVIPIDICILAHPTIQKTMTALLKMQEFHAITAICTEIEFLYHPQHATCILLCHLQRKARPTDRNKAGALLSQCPDLEHIFFTGTDFALEPFHGKTCETGKKELWDAFIVNIDSRTSIHPEKKVIHYELGWEVGGFCQVNMGQNKNLVQFILSQAATAIQDSQVLDLFCGMGNFSIPLSFCSSQVTGIENQGSSIRMAQKNAMHNERTNLTFFRQTAEQGCLQLHAQKKHFSLTLLDPPRQGLTGAHQEICEMTDSCIIYISCDPATLVRDLAQLSSHGFTLREVQPFDMFPQTHHIETVAILTR